MQSTVGNNEELPMRATHRHDRDSLPPLANRRIRLPEVAAALALAAFLQTPGAIAADFSDENTLITIDTTLSHGFSWRVSDRDETLIGVNSDDGDLNFDKGLISNTSKFNTEVEVDNGEIGLFGRFQGFIDFENRNGKRERTPLSKEAKGDVGDGLDILDLYATARFEAGDTPVDLRIGNQVLNWGESTFIQNGINVINPFDVSKLRKPGAELRDGLLPVPMVSIAADLTPNVSIEGFYQTAWKETKVDPTGTYFSTNDYGTPGGERAFIPVDPLKVLDKDKGGITLPGTSNVIPAGPQLMALGFSARDYPLSVRRSADREPKDTDQWGIALRYYVEQLNDTEIGLYFTNYHSRLPLASARYGTEAGLTAGIGAADVLSQVPQTEPLAVPAAIDHYASTASYAIEYPEDLRVLGLSFNTALGATGWALQGEYSYHPDQPLQIHENHIFGLGLAPILCRSEVSDADRLRELGCPPEAAYDLYLRPLLGTRLSGYIERDVSQVQVTATRVFGPMIGADSLVLAGEVALHHVHSLPDSKGTPLDTPGSAEAATANSYGYRLASRLDYNNAIGPATVSPYLQFQHDVEGYSPSPAGPFEEGRTALTLGVGMNYLERWRGDLSYTNFNGDTNQLSDRDFVSLSMSYSF